MSLRGWLFLIGMMVSLGTLKVAQQTAIWLKAYELGTRRAAVHALENDTLWLRQQVSGLQSPARLAQAMNQENRRLVAWSVLPTELRTGQLAHAGRVVSQHHTSD